jgi:hypothetical protein
MMTRSGHYYGPIPSDWGQALEEILQDIAIYQEFQDLPVAVLVCADLLDHLKKQQMDEILWVYKLSTELSELQKELAKAGHTVGIQERVRQLNERVTGGVTED